MQYYHLKTAKTYDELMNLFFQSSLPIDVRRHVESLIEGHVEAKVEEMSEVSARDAAALAHIIRWYTDALIAAKGRKGASAEAIDNLVTALKTEITGSLRPVATAIVDKHI